ncbi:unnamed protein product [Dicrocoelium dendriticum]|nr:unnamed protein product [Dicrocoelium dendriticum]
MHKTKPRPCVPTLWRLLIFTYYYLSFVRALTKVKPIVYGVQHWQLVDSPFVIEDGDLLIPPDATLRIDPGVHVLLGPGLTIKVRGTLIARGLPNAKIVFDSLLAAGRFNITNMGVRGDVVETDPSAQRIRLVDGSEVRLGHLQLWIANHWRYVCSRNRVWTKDDCRVACQQLGYSDGNFTLGPTAPRRTAGIEILAPKCKGNEAFNVFAKTDTSGGLFSCPGTIEHARIGSGVCKWQDLVGLNCWGVTERWYDHYWKGIELDNTTTTEINIPLEWGGSVGNTRLNISTSILEHIEILHAGVNRSRHQVAALSASPYPPVLNNVRLAHNAYDALNFSLIRGPAILQNVTLEGNSGHGAVVSTLFGYVRLLGVNAHDNGGDGARIHMVSGSEYHWPDEAPELVHRAHWPCRPGAIPASPVFPFLVVSELPGPTFRKSGSCELRIESDQSIQVLTVTPLEVLHDPLASGVLDVWDTVTGEQLAHWKLRNESAKLGHLGVRYGRLYQGVSSVKNKILIRLTWEKPAQQAVCSQFASCVRIVLQVAVGLTKMPEVIIEDSRFLNNMHRGVRISSPWSYLRVVRSRFESNRYRAGLQIVSGSADLFLHNCSFLHNEHAGLNVGTIGGFRQINQTLFAENRGHGLEVWNIPSTEGRQPNSIIATHIHTSSFIANWWNGIQSLNSCRPFLSLVNYSIFERNGLSGIRQYSCLEEYHTRSMTNFTVGYSHFRDNGQRAIWVEPMTRMHGHITNCTFVDHQHGTILVDNSQDLVSGEWFRSAPVKYVIRNSKFMNNCGPNVLNLRLTEISELQRMDVIFNIFLHNRVTTLFSGLNPRSSAAAVVIIGSSNIIVQRNHFWNPASNIEVASDLSAPDKRINVTLNYWGSLLDWNATDWSYIHKAVHMKLFDQNHRYTLARIEYHPVLKDPDLHSYFTSANEPPYVPEFIQFEPGSHQVRIGGRIAVERARRVELAPLADPKDYYHVISDIFVPPGGVLAVQPGARLLFEPGVGLFSQGELQLMGTEGAPINMELWGPEMANHSNLFPNFTKIPITTEQAQAHLSAFGNRTVRLTGGHWNSHSFVGRLEIALPLKVNVNRTGIHQSGELVWGTVCSEGFGPHAAMLACSALGLAAHPKDWLVSRELRDRVAANANHWANTNHMPVHLAYLDCDSHNSDLILCEHDPAGQHNCPHTYDVVLRCHQPGWAGIRVAASDTGSRTPVRHVHLSDAGLLDYMRLEYTPAFQLDYYGSTIEHLSIKRSRSHGLRLVQSHPLDGTTLVNSQIMDSFEHALLTHTPWLQILNCSLKRSQVGAGLAYVPSISPGEIFQLRSGMVQTLTLFDQSAAGNTKEPVLEDWNLVKQWHKLHPTGLTFVNVQSGRMREKTIYKAELAADDVHHMHQIVIHLLDFPASTSPTSRDQARVAPNATVGPTSGPPGLLPASPLHSRTSRSKYTDEKTLEEVIIYDAPMDTVEPQRSYSWHIPRDLVHLPLISSAHRVTIELRVQGIRSGRLLFAVETRNFQYSIHLRDYATSGAQLHREAFGAEPEARYSPVPHLRVVNTTVNSNAIGLVLYHCNHPTDSYDRLCWRNAGEVFTFTDSTVAYSNGLAVHMDSFSRFRTDWGEPLHADFDQFEERLSLIAHRFENCHFLGNTGGFILTEQTPTHFANNVWSFLLANSHFENNSVLQDNLYREQKGIRFHLPFVGKQYDWRYNPDATHRLQLIRNTFTHNQCFTLSVDGYYAEVELSDNLVEENSCHTSHGQAVKCNGLICFEGMEKSIRVNRNRIAGNQKCDFVLGFHTLSQSPASSEFVAKVVNNFIQDNSCAEMALTSGSFANPPTCYAVGIFGPLNVTVQQNILSNMEQTSVHGGMRYELAASVRSTNSLNYFDATNNFWGTANESRIRDRIFQFDNWNSFSVVNFDRYFINEKLSGTAMTKTAANDREIRVMTFGGRLPCSASLVYRNQPYQVNSDLTVLPGCELRIDAGVCLKFSPNVGLLVLGRLVAQGFKNRPIRFTTMHTPSDPLTEPARPLESQFQRDNVVGSRSKHDAGRGRLGLSTDSVRLVGGEQHYEGFVHFYNSTAQSWSIVCDRQFSTEVAQVVCYEVGQPTLNAIVRVSHLYDIRVYGYDNPFVKKHIWMESYACNGFERHRHQCSRRFNYDHESCLQERGYVFLRCAPTPHIRRNTSESNLFSFTWGNIRIIQQLPEKDDPEMEEAKQSVLEYVTLERAGLLHGQRVSAVTTVHAHPRISHVSIIDCLGDGFEFITPRGVIDMSNTTVRGCLGRAVSLIALNSDSIDPTTSGWEASKKLEHLRPTVYPRQGSLLPAPQPSPGSPRTVTTSDLTRLPLEEYPYSVEHNILGFTPMCASEKTLHVLDRVVVQYQYSWVGLQICTKIFRSQIPGRRLAWRFLAVKLGQDQLAKNTLELYNGANFNTTHLIAKVTSETLNNHSSPVNERYTFLTSPVHDVLSVHLFASPASKRHGFVAEVVTLPLSPGRMYSETNNALRHRVDTCEFQSNQGGGIRVLSVGENGPDLYMSNLRLIDNGVRILNLTGPAAVYLRVTNSINLGITNCLIFRHEGHAIHALLYASQAARGTTVNVTNNAVVRNQNGGVLWLEGNQFSVSQILRNYFTHNNADQLELIRIQGVVARPFAHNFVHDNIAGLVLQCSGDEDMSRGSLFEQNGFYKNEAINTTWRSTVFAAHSRNVFRNNYFKNHANHYELAMGNRSILRSV